MNLRRAVNDLNDALAVTATKQIGTMWCVYLFIAVALVPTVAPSLESAVQYTSSSFLQLVFLPLIMVGQEVMGRKTEKRAQQDHKALLEALKRLEDIHTDLASGSACKHRR